MSYVYRAYGDDGRLLYVGCAEDIERRLRYHGHASAWVDQLVNVTVEQHPDRTTAEAAERQAIASEAPLYNIKLSSIDRRAARAALREYERTCCFWSPAERTRRYRERRRLIEQALLKAGIELQWIGGRRNVAWSGGDHVATR